MSAGESKAAPRPGQDATRKKVRAHYATYIEEGQIPVVDKLAFVAHRDCAGCYAPNIAGLPTTTRCAESWKCDLVFCPKCVEKHMRHGFCMHCTKRHKYDFQCGKCYHCVKRT